MRTGRKNVLMVFGIIVVVVLSIFVGYITSSLQAGSGSQPGAIGATGTSGSLPVQSPATDKSAVAGDGTTSSEGYSLTNGAPQATPPNGTTSSPASSPSVQRLVISRAAISLRVDAVDKAVSDIRALATKYGAIISDLTLDAGAQPIPDPVPLESRGDVASTPSPSSAQITLRVPTAKLSQLESEATKLGTVLSQSASESDVTQEHVDMAARLMNLQAEEVRLREFLKRATKVSEMLDVERELSRVRGEIESMQAQLAYLERQTSLATLTIAVSETGPVVRPTAGGWGFLEAVTNGIQAAASMVRLFISGAIALSPLLIVALLGWGLWRVVRRNRDRRNPAEMPDEGPHEDASGE